MRKMALFLAIILVISIPLSVSAAPRALSINPTLGFNGMIAECEVHVAGDNTSEYIEVTLTLKRGSDCIETWTASGYGYVYMYEEAIITKYATYTLVAQVTVNNVASTPVSVSARCVSIA